MTQTWTILSLLQWAAEYFTKQGSPSARLDAELLLSHCLGLKRMELYLQFERPLQALELAAFKLLVKRRAAHEPVAYIIGQKEFWSLPFKVTPDVLIPRPETELLVSFVLESIQALGQESIKILDVGSGSGNISISLAKSNPLCHLSCLDVSSQALRLAGENAQNHGVEGRCEFIEANFLEDDLEKWEGKFDVVVSNPPYIATSEIEKLGENVKAFEPLKALDGGADGLVFYRRLSQRAPYLLKPHGLLAVEIGDDQGGSVLDLFTQAGFGEVVLKRDLAGLPRVVGAKNLKR